MTQEQQKEKQELLKIKVRYLESLAGKQMMADLKKDIAVSLKWLIEIMNNPKADFDRDFHIQAAKLQTHVAHYKKHIEPKKELAILEEALLEE